MAKMLVFMTRNGPKAEGIHRAIMQLNSETDRSVAIVGGAIVENALEGAVVSMLHTDKRMADEMFRTTGPLGTFASKIRIGFLIGAYGREALKDLTIVKDIRNTFAHSLDYSSFKDQKIADWCKNMKLAEKFSVENGEKPSHGLRGCISVIERERHLSDPRERFLIEAQILSVQLSAPSSTTMPKPLF